MKSNKNLGIQTGNTKRRNDLCDNFNLKFSFFYIFLYQVKYFESKE